MAMSVTITEQAPAVGPIKLVKLVWVSAADGTASGTTTNSYNGAIKALVTVPAGGGSAPTDNYDIVVNDENSLDALAGTGANRSTSATQYVVASLGYVSNSKLTLGIAAAGDTKGGTIYLFVDQG